MFTDPGKKIKALAIIYFLFGLIGSIVLAIVFGKDVVGIYYTREEINVAKFLGIFVGGAFVAYVSSLFLYAFGELVENSTDIINSLLNVKSLLSSIKEQNNINSQPIENASKSLSDSSRVTNKYSTEVQKPQKRSASFKEYLQYANKFSTDDGIINYLTGIENNLNPDDRIQLAQLLKTPRSQLRDKINNILLDSD